MLTQPTIREVKENPLIIKDLKPDLFSDDGLEVLNAKAVMAELGLRCNLNILSLINDIRQGGVQNAPNGVIQDPAGSAVGASEKPTDCGAGGASGQIYKKFTDLKPIPNMDVCSAIFNSSSGPGMRVLHTYSPQLEGSPKEGNARASALQNMSNAFYNAFIAFGEYSEILEDDGKLINLVPISAAIFANKFITIFNKDSHQIRHLHPSYTITSILLALVYLEERGKKIPDISIYYYDKPVYGAAIKFQKTLCS